MLKHSMYGVVQRRQYTRFAWRSHNV